MIVCRRWSEKFYAIECNFGHKTDQINRLVENHKNKLLDFDLRVTVQRLKTCTMLE